MRPSILPPLSSGAERASVSYHSALEADWRLWLLTLFADYVSDASGQPVPFGSHHEAFWEWVWALRRGMRPQPFVAVWPRGGAKSTSTELACVALGARAARSYVLYVGETQEQADDHVQNVGAMLESPLVETFYPELASRLVGKYGNSKGWRRNRLRTADGFTIDAIGLDSAARGVKLDNERPDLIIIDDVDGENDTVATVGRKIKTLTRKLLPAGSADCAVLAVQNLVHGDSIFAQLVDGRADFLADRVVSGPYPALVGAAYEQRGDGRWYVTAGEPTWAGQDAAACQRFVSDWGITAFRVECQHEVDEGDGGLFGHLSFRHCAWDEVPWPAILRTVVWVDPAVTDTDQSDSHGIQADALASDGTIYRLYSWEDRTSPEDSLTRAIRKGAELKAEAVGVETDQGGDLWEATYRQVARTLRDSEGIAAPAFRSDKAGAGHGPKAHRASLMLADYEKGRIVHVLGTHATLEAALRRFLVRKPFDLVDAAFWAWNDLRTSDPSPVLAQGVVHAAPWMTGRVGEPGETGSSRVTVFEPDQTPHTPVPPRPPLMGPGGLTIRPVL